MIERALIAGGGTGGHVYPAVGVAEELLRRAPAAEILFVGTAEGLEAQILPRLGLRLETISASRLVGAGVVGRVTGLCRLVVGLGQSLGLLRRFRPQIVLGMGGYASGPALLAAWICRYPTAIQEQNAHAGFTNRTLGRLVRVVYLGFEAAAARFPTGRTVFTGNPLRRAVAEALRARDERPQAAAGRLRLLVFGGSQGARFLNERVPATLASLVAAHPELDVSVVHQTGPGDEQATRARYAETSLAGGARVTVTPFIHDMPAAYAGADLAICRAGALTIAELTAVGLPSLLVPFPFAAGDHQAANAKVLADAGAARAIRQEDWRSEEVIRWLAELAGAPERLAAMSAAARELAHPDAARALVDHLEGVAA